MPVIQTRSVKPMSAVVTVYVAGASHPAIGTHDERSPGGLQRRHEYVNMSGVEPSHVPESDRERLVDVFCPKICGVTRRCGASAVTGAVDSEFCEAVPWQFVAVTCTRSRLP